MLTLVEGLNCSGKTTYIKNHKSQVIDTWYANPLRWDNSKNLLMGSLEKKEYYGIGVYETILRMFLSSYSAPDYYWDRTWISAYVYKTLTKPSFDFISDLYCENCVKVIWLDTNPFICKDRWEAENKKDEKDYVVNFDWKGLRDEFETVMTELDKMGMNVEVITNYGV